MKATIATVGELFGLLQLEGETALIDQIGPMRLYRGDDAVYRLTVTDDEDERINLTGATIECEVKATLGAADPALIVGTVAILTQSGDTLGQASITISSANSNIAPGLYWIDVVVTLASVRTHVIPPREFTLAAVVNLPA